ncbi:MAG: ParB N-terminal domain-containing protein [Thermomicrobiales bacterium]
MRFEDVPLDDIGKTWGPRPTERMVAHIRQHGVLMPVLLAEAPDDDGVLALRLVDGNRRVAAAREAGLTHIPAIVVGAMDDAAIAELTIAANTLRTNNPVTEWWAIDDLHQAGIRDTTIAERTGMTPATLKARTRYGQLDPRIFSGLVYGRIAPSVVDKAVRLPIEAQDRIGEAFEETGSLQTWQVEQEAKKYRQPRAGSAPQSPEDLAFQLDALASAAKGLGLDRDAWLRAAAEAFDRIEDEPGEE